MLRHSSLFDKSKVTANYAGDFYGITQDKFEEVVSSLNLDIPEEKIIENLSAMSRHGRHSYSENYVLSVTGVEVESAEFSLLRLLECIGTLVYNKSAYIDNRFKEEFANAQQTLYDISNASEDKNLQSISQLAGNFALLYSLEKFHQFK